ncbi:preprotein translocase subunit SecG [Candidatus Gracilibacteria bacterium]|nr:preprotein translocase subunit SecG [Candidatus Gracilibacteria bacterium]
MIEILQVSEVFIGILLIAVILIQNKSVALNLTSMSGGMNETTKRGAEKVLHNATIVLSALFIFNSLALFLVS